MYQWHLGLTGMNRAFCPNARLRARMGRCRPLRVTNHVQSSEWDTTNYEQVL